MAEPVCPRCKERPRHRTPSQVLAWCRECINERGKEKREARQRAGPSTGNLTQGGKLELLAPAAVVRREEIASGARHVVADVRFGPGRRSSCSCGDLFEGHTSDEAMADAFARHAKEANGRGWSGHDPGPDSLARDVREGRDAVASTG